MQHLTIRESHHDIRMTPCGSPPPRNAFLDFDPILLGWPEVQESDGIDHSSKRTPEANETRDARDGRVERDGKRHRASN
jgi:hypothetical protein